MKCYYDPTQDAVGVCRSCQRGVSPGHLTDMGKGLACKGRCEADVTAVIALVERGIKSSVATNQMLKRATQAGYGAGIFMIAMGVMFAWNGMDHGHVNFTFYMGLGFVVYGLWHLVRARRHGMLVARIPDEEEGK